MVVTVVEGNIQIFCLGLPPKDLYTIVLRRTIPFVSSADGFVEKEEKSGKKKVLSSNIVPLYFGAKLR